MICAQRRKWTKGLRFWIFHPSMYGNQKNLCNINIKGIPLTCIPPTHFALLPYQYASAHNSDAPHRLGASSCRGFRLHCCQCCGEDQIIGIFLHFELTAVSFDSFQTK